MLAACGFVRAFGPVQQSKWIKRARKRQDEENFYSPYPGNWLRRGRIVVATLMYILLADVVQARIGFGTSIVLVAANCDIASFYSECF